MQDKIDIKSNISAVCISGCLHVAINLCICMVAAKPKPSVCKFKLSSISSCSIVDYRRQDHAHPPARSI